MSVCNKLDLVFIVPAYIIQDASHAEANAAWEVFGSNVVIVMCWFHLLFNVRKHESLNQVPKSVKDMVIADLTRMHYCLEYEFEPYKAIVMKKWKSMPELTDFVIYIWNQWFIGTFSNWHIFKTPPGFANTNNPMESFNKIIKAIFTHYMEHRLFHFIMLIVDHLLPFYCSIDKEFKMYRVPHKKTIEKAHILFKAKFTMRGEVTCEYRGVVHVHTINFRFKSCSCRWFLAFGVCGHLVAACDLFNQPLEGYTKTKVFVYRARRGRKKKEIEMSAAACSAMPVIEIPVSNAIIESNREELFQRGALSLPLPSLNPSYVPVPDVVPDIHIPDVPVAVACKPVVRSSKRLEKGPVSLPETPKKKGGQGRYHPHLCVYKLMWCVTQSL